MTYYSYTYNKKILNEKPTALNQTNDIQAARSTAASEPTQQGQYSPNQTQPIDKDSVDVKVLKASDFIPSLEGKPWTAPVAIDVLVIQTKQHLYAVWTKACVLTLLKMAYTTLTTTAVLHKLMQRQPTKQTHYHE